MVIMVLFYKSVMLRKDPKLFERLILIIMLFISVLIVLVTLFLLEPNIMFQQDVKYEFLVNEIFNEVLTDVEEMRNLTSSKKAELEIVSIQYFIDDAEDNVINKHEEINLEDIIYKSLFLIPQNYSLGESKIVQASKILAAVSGTKLYIVREYFNPLNIFAAKRTLAHEITHLLQSQFKSPNLITSDQRWAWLSLIEGDADFTADTYQSQSGLFSHQLNSIGSLDEITGFPYKYGSNFVLALYEDGGWAQVNNAYDKPPRSTKEVLHPDLFLNSVSIKNVDALYPNSNEWEMLLTDTYGEHFIRIMLQNGVSIEEAEIASAGWNGDNLSLFNKGESYLVTWCINWDTINDSSEFINSYSNMITKIGGNIIEPDLYYLNDHYISFSKKGTITQIASSTDKETIIFMLNLIMP